MKRNKADVIIFEKGAESLKISGGPDLPNKSIARISVIPGGPGKIRPAEKDLAAGEGGGVVEKRRV
jgi:hypothetical protein